MSKSQKHLPPGWIEANLKDLVHRLQYGHTAKASPNIEEPKFLRITDIQDDGVDWDKVPGCIISAQDIEKYRLADGDLVFARSGSIEKAYLVTDPPLSIFASYLIRGKPFHKQIGFYLQYFVKSRNYLSQIGAFGSGIAMQNVNASKLGIVKIPIPPLNEQKRIVARIEELQVRSHRAKESLEAIPELLEQLRRSTLAAAFRGDLTKAWREKHRDVEPAIELLKRIRTERRKRWEEAELEKLKAKGLTGDTLSEEFAKRRKQYREPVPVDTSDLPELPEKWCWASIEELSQWITDGTHQPPPFTDKGIPFLVISNMMSGNITWDKVQKWVSTETYDKYTSIYKPSFGDIIYSTVGSYGVAVEVMAHEKFMFQRHIAHIRPISNHLSVSYLSFCLNSPICKEQADKVARGVAQKTVNLSDLRRFAIPLAPLSEQYKLNELLSKSFEILDNQRRNLNSSLTKLYNFEQSILTKAFRGELVTQDPNDEPAAILLERILQEKARESAQPKAKDKRKGKKMKKSFHCLKDSAE